VIATTAFAVGCYPAPVAARDWKLIHSYEGTIDPADGVLRVKVYSANVQRDSLLDSMVYLQNRIEVQSPSGDVRSFMWPVEEFAGTACDVLDLDGDGVKEVVVRGPTCARVVSYRNGKFLYRDRMGDGGDDLLSVTRLEMLDIDGDGRVEFVTFGNASLAEVGKVPPEPSLRRWTRDGFQPAPPGLLEAYKKKRLTGQ
jgi:hypothetical protein